MPISKSGLRKEFGKQYGIKQRILGIIYYRGKVVGGIYDDRFLVKPTKSAAAMMPNADMELPAPKKRSKQS